MTMELKEAEQDIINEFTSSLCDLVVNSRPMIQMLTMLADDHSALAPAIVAAIEKRLLQAPAGCKLPIMYVIDSICKNTKKNYNKIFMHNLVSNFCAVFSKVDEKTRACLFKMRNTWAGIFPATKLYSLDARVQMLDPAWPIAPMPTSSTKASNASSSIHVNPKFLQDATIAAPQPADDTTKMMEIILEKQKGLLDLQEKRVALELLQTKAYLEDRKQTGTSLAFNTSNSIHKAPENARSTVKPFGLNLPSTSSLLSKSSLMSTKTVIRPATISAARPSAVEPNTTQISNKDPRLAKSSISHVQKSILPSAKVAYDMRREMVSSPDIVILPENSKTVPKGIKSPSKREGSQKRENGKSDAKKSLKSRSSSSSSSSTLSPSKSHKTSKSSKKETKSSKKAAVPDGKFKDIKSIHLRNYVRKARSVSSSPEPPGALEKKSLAVSKPSKQASDQDVDLRRLASPTGKKRGSTPEKGADQPSSPKRSKQSEMLTELFGREDVDLRQMEAPVRAEMKKAPDWARFKETNPDTYRSPLKNCWDNGSDLSLSDIEIAPPPPMPKIIIPDELKISPGARKSSVFDSLGRPLLHSRLSGEDPRERRRSSSLTEDVDLRPMFSDLNEGQEANEKINMMISQADEQLKNGTLNMNDYRALLREVKARSMRKRRACSNVFQVVQINEANKLREAQRRDEQENWTDSNSWQDEDSQDSAGKASPDDNDAKDSNDRRYRKRDESRKHNDVDERFPPRRDFHPRGGGRGGFVRPNRGGWGEGNVQRPQWDENRWQGGPNRPPFMRGGPRGHFPRGGGGMQGEFGAPRFWGPQGPRPGQFHSTFPPPMHPANRPGIKGADLPMPDPREMELARLNYCRTLNIDGVARDIRHYGEHTIILMSWDDPRSISFYPGERQVQFESGQSVLCKLDGKHEDVLVNGMLHRVKLGAPTRELNIDGKDYECYFGGNPVTVDLNGINIRVQLEGPAPSVKIGEDRRGDICAGKIHLVIDAVHRVPVYLDATPQVFHVDGVPHVLKFIEAFKRVTINGQKFSFDYGGLPQQIFVRNQRHYIGFTSLPPWINPGCITIANMEGGRLPSPPREEPPAPLVPEIAVPLEPESHTPALPMFGGAKNKNKSEKSTSAQEPRKVPLSRSILNTKPQLDVLTNLIQGAPTETPTGFNYQMHQDKEQDKAQEPAATAVAPDLAELLAKLNEYGILQSINAVEAKKKEEVQKKEEVYKPVTLTQDSLRIRQTGSYSNLYCGIQCSTCGLRFPPEQTLRYSQHLDWHFRQNRREKDSAKKAQSRKWYYDVSDWIQFEEIEDLEERAQSWFETQEEDKPEEVEAEIPTVLAGENNSCGMCHELFEQFYNNEKDEWHFRDAIRVEDKVYHPHCYQDLQNAIDTTVDTAVSEDVAELSTLADADVEMKDEEVKDEAEEVVKEEPEPEGDNASEAPASEETAVEEKPVVTEAETAETEPMELSTPKEETREPADDLIVVEVKKEPLQVDTIDVESELVADDSEQNNDSGMFSQSTADNIKEEPIDPMDEEEMAPPPVVVQEVDTTKNEFKSSIDGNVEFDMAPIAAAAPLGKIKININTPAPALPEPVAKEEEPETPTCYMEEPMKFPEPRDEDFDLKPKLRGRKLTEMPPVSKGREDSALCTIM